MSRALEAQRAGRLVDAIAGYEAVLAEQPDNFDAVHMLGVTHYQRGEFGTAMPLLERAVRLRPELDAARQNLQLAEAATQRMAIERELAREILPRMAWLCEPPAPPRTRTLQCDAVHVVWPPDCDATAQPLRSLIDAIGFTAPVRHWIPAGAGSPAAVGEFAVLDPLRDDYPAGGYLVVIGAAAPVRRHLERIELDGVAWVPTNADASAALDRVRDLAEDGRRRIALWFADASIALALGLPGVTLAARPGIFSAGH